MAKGIGLIGNFQGKVGNMVGYKLSDSNTGNSQGIRVYQPIVRNPKTSAQAEQRAKLAPINATYRALKMIIDRGNEGLPYGNKSRLAWLKQALKAEKMPWFVKGATVNMPVVAPLTKGSLPSIGYSANEDGMTIECNGVTTSTDLTTVGKLSTALLAGYSWLKDGDQITFVFAGSQNGALGAQVISIIIDTTSTAAFSGLTASTDSITYEIAGAKGCAAVIVSREGANGEHLRSNTMLSIDPGLAADAPYDDTSKTAAIESYQNAASANADWAEESIQ